MFNHDIHLIFYLVGPFVGLNHLREKWLFFNEWFDTKCGQVSWELCRKISERWNCILYRSCWKNKIKRFNTDYHRRRRRKRVTNPILSLTWSTLFFRSKRNLDSFSRWLDSLVIPAFSELKTRDTFDLNSWTDRKVSCKSPTVVILENWNTTTTWEVDNSRQRIL